MSLVSLCLLLALPAGAHHSGAAFDREKSVTVTGTVNSVEWTSPHARLKVDAKDETGAIVHWTFSAGSPGALSRRGFKRGDLKLGDTIIVDGYLARDGSHTMDARRVTLSDGRIVSGASAGDGGPGAETQAPSSR